MTETCTLRKPTRVNDGSGGSTIVWVETTTVPCYVGQQYYSAFSKVYGERMTTTEPFRFVLPIEYVPARTDQILYRTNTYSVLGVLAPRTYDTATVVIARRFE